MIRPAAHPFGPIVEITSDNPKLATAAQKTVAASQWSWWKKIVQNAALPSKIWGPGFWKRLSRPTTRDVPAQAWSKVPNKPAGKDLCGKRLPRRTPTFGFVMLILVLEAVSSPDFSS
jgi:hypothetical protein